MKIIKRLIPNKEIFWISIMPLFAVTYVSLYKEIHIILAIIITLIMSMLFSNVVEFMDKYEKKSNKR